MTNKEGLKCFVQEFKLVHQNNREIRKGADTLSAP